MTTVDLIKETNKDKDDIQAYVDKIFENNKQGLLFHHFTELCLNQTSDLLFLVLNCFQENIPCYKNFLKVRSHYYDV